MNKLLKGNLVKNQFEQSAWSLNNILCGIDEAGRGSFAGPVVAATVILPHGQAPEFLKDSKIMTKKARNDAFLWITDNCMYGVGIVNHRVIDTSNIVEATKYAMKRSILEAKSKSHKELSAILVDAVHLKIDDIGLTIPVHAFSYGETYSSSIAAASIVAKVIRDRLMESYHQIFPLYQFANHKGYGTKVHQSTIYEQGLSVIHRKSFCKKTRLSEER